MDGPGPVLQAGEEVEAVAVDPEDGRGAFVGVVCGVGDCVVLGAGEGRGVDLDADY